MLKNIVQDAPLIVQARKCTRAKQKKIMVEIEYKRSFTFPIFSSSPLFLPKILGGGEGARGQGGRFAPGKKGFAS